MTSTEPHVGVFYWIGGKALVRSRPLSAVDHPGRDRRRDDEIVSFGTHFSFWRTLRDTSPEWSDKDDSVFPRGRILYKPARDRFILRMDGCIPAAAVPLILREFHLADAAPDKLRLVHGPDPDTGDHHYQCAHCGPETRRRVL